MDKFADVLVDWLCDLGYDHAFFVAGGNIMHLLDAARKRLTCVPFVHEVAAGIAAEVYNASRPSGAKRAFVLVTAGPGLTNVVTAIAGAWLESRELLVIGGTVKSSDLSLGAVRQRGIQEIDGVSIVQSLTTFAKRLDRPVTRLEIEDAVMRGRTGRRGPVFLEMCLDVQACPVDRSELERPSAATAIAANGDAVDHAREASVHLAAEIRAARRPVLLIGGGVNRSDALALGEKLRHLPVAIMTTWNGMDRIDARAPTFFGRPNQWGQRHANVLVQQSDFLLALGTRLGLQQTGFNWQEFAPLATVAQVDLDPAELAKGHPDVELTFVADANAVLRHLVDADLGVHDEWLAFCAEVRDALPLADPGNSTARGYIDPYRFAQDLASVCTERDIVIPCSSGGAFTTMMQAFLQRSGQIVITDKGLAAMGYGLSASIGAALANRDRRTILVEGDGGFSQNLQELATVAVNQLGLKIFVYANEGYASIRMVQRNYFAGEYLGCDTRTGLGFPNWAKLFDAYDIPVLELDASGLATRGAKELFEGPGPAAFVVPIDPEQTYYPRITSRVTATGSMQSSPLHLMFPDLSDELARKVFRYIESDLHASVSR